MAEVGGLIHLLDKSVESSRRYDEVPSTFQSAGETPTNHVHVVALCLEINCLVLLHVLQRYHLGHLVSQFSVRTI